MSDDPSQAHFTEVASLSLTPSNLSFKARNLYLSGAPEDVVAEVTQPSCSFIHFPAQATARAIPEGVISHPSAHAFSLTF